MKTPIYLIAGVATAGVALAAPISRRDEDDTLQRRQISPPPTPFPWYPTSTYPGGGQGNGASAAGAGVAGGAGGASSSNLSLGGGSVEQNLNRFVPAPLKQDINNRISSYQTMYQDKVKKVEDFWSDPVKWGMDKLAAFFHPILHPFESAKNTYNTAQLRMQAQYDAAKAQYLQTTQAITHPVTAFNNAVDQKRQEITGQINQNVQAVKNAQQGVIDYKNQVQNGGSSSSSSSSSSS